MILFHKDFEKKQKRFDKKVRVRLYSRLKIFEKDMHNPILNNHPLHGEWQGYWSINITGDVRAIYYLQHADTFIFVDIDTHSNLY